MANEKTNMAEEKDICPFKPTVCIEGNYMAWECNNCAIINGYKSVVNFFGKKESKPINPILPIQAVKVVEQNVNKKPDQLENDDSDIPYKRTKRTIFGQEFLCPKCQGGLIYRKNYDQNRDKVFLGGFCKECHFRPEEIEYNPEKHKDVLR